MRGKSLKFDLGLLLFFIIIGIITGLITGRWEGLFVPTFIVLYLATPVYMCMFENWKKAISIPSITLIVALFIIYSGLGNDDETSRVIGIASTSCLLIFVGMCSFIIRAAHEEFIQRPPYQHYDNFSDYYIKTYLPKMRNECKQIIDNTFNNDIMDKQ